MPARGNRTHGQGAILACPHFGKRGRGSLLVFRERPALSGNDMEGLEECLEMLDPMDAPLPGPSPSMARGPKAELGRRNHVCTHCRRGPFAHPIRGVTAKAPGQGGAWDGKAHARSPVCAAE